MAMMTECCAAPAVRRGWLRGWWAARRARLACRRSLAEIPAHLRKDVGLDGGLPLASRTNGGRSFLSSVCPDRALRGWEW